MSKAFQVQLAQNEAQLIDGIARVRERKGMTREQLSLAMGAPKNLISKLESHSRGLEGALIMAIAKALNMKVDRLMREALRDVDTE
jgi:transcriptional regulator with XRE-family HTH domain